jgi:hypothetical protein
MPACLLHPAVFFLGACCRPPVLHPASAARHCSSLLGATAWPSYSSYDAPRRPFFLFSPARALLGALASLSSRTYGALCPMAVGLPGSHGTQRSSASPFDLLLSSASFTPHARSGVGPCPAGPAPPPPPSSPSLDPSLSRPSRPNPRCCDLSGSIRRPFGWIVSSRLDPSLSWPSRPDLPFLLLFCHGRRHHDRRRRVRCCRPSWRGSLTPGRLKK